MSVPLTAPKQDLAEIDAPSEGHEPPRISSDGTKKWYYHHRLHRDDGPAIEYVNGSKVWYRHGQLHREFEPAVEYADGTKMWWLHGQRHREDGPAVEDADGAKYWYRNGQIHREDGPAVEYPSGVGKWWLNGQQYTQLQWLREVLKDRPLTPHQHELLLALSENWEGTPELLYETVTHLA